MFGLGPRKGRRRSSRQIAVNQYLEQVMRFIRRLLPPVMILLGMVLTVYALRLAESTMYQRAEYRRPVTFELSGVPEHARPQVHLDLQDLSTRPWIDPDLCPEIYTRLQDNPWLQEVTRVGKATPGVIEVTCVPRTPVALVQHHEYFFLVDEYGYRLPGRYTYDSTWMLLQGVREAPPEPGGRWPGPDMAAGLKLINLLRGQPYAEQVSAVLVHNYDGRVNSRNCHVELITLPDHGRVLWGSAPGEELVENTVAQKLHILEENYRRHGKISGDHPVIDVSVFPDRYLVPDLALGE